MKIIAFFASAVNSFFESSSRVFACPPKGEGHISFRVVESRHDPRNPHSGMVMQKCGMRYEGTLRSADRNNQGICDTSWYALLRDER